MKKIILTGTLISSGVLVAVVNYPSSAPVRVEAVHRQPVIASSAPAPAPVPSPAIAPPAPVLVSTANAVAAVDWTQQFADSDDKDVGDVLKRATQAARNGDSEAAFALSKYVRESGKSTPEILATVQNDIIDMVDSRKVNAMFSAGMMMASVRQASMETLVVPFSMMLAACRLGAECVSNRWAISGQPASFADALPALAPAAIYQAVDARAAEIVDAYQRHDTDAMHSFSAMTSGAQIADSQEGK